MVKFYTSAFTYDYTFPAVCLAHVLRYPNPLSTHVISIDTIDSHFDPSTQRLTTTRLLLKKSKIPTAVLKLLPKSFVPTNHSSPASLQTQNLSSELSSDAQPQQQRSYILEKSTVDVRTGHMHTESRNLEFRGILSVVEEQEYSRCNDDGGGDGRTDVVSTVTLRSRVGETIRRRQQNIQQGQGVGSSSDAVDESDTALGGGYEASDEQPRRAGFLRSLTTGSIQRSIELLGLRRTEGSQPKAKEGLKIVLERLRTGGLVGVLEGMRRDREGVESSSPSGGAE